jgi:hypothetical protein
MKLLRVAGVMVLLPCAAAACAAAPGDETDVRTLASDEEPLSPCDAGAECTEGVAGLEFVNSSGAHRRVHVNGELVCELDAEESCSTAIEAHVKAIVHVTDELGGAVCSDPEATLASCTCASLEILC